MAFECPICLELFDLSDHEPLVLGCGHTFGKCCLAELASHNSSRKFRCPLDKHSIVGPVHLIPRNYALRSALEAFQETPEGKLARDTTGKKERNVRNMPLPQLRAASAPPCFAKPALSCSLPSLCPTADPVTRQFSFGAPGSLALMRSQGLEIVDVLDSWGVLEPTELVKTLARLTLHLKTDVSAVAADVVAAKVIPILASEDSSVVSSACAVLRISLNHNSKQVAQQCRKLSGEAARSLLLRLDPRVTDDSILEAALRYLSLPPFSSAVTRCSGTSTVVALLEHPQCQVVCAAAACCASLANHHAGRSQLQQSSVISKSSDILKSTDASSDTLRHILRMLKRMCRSTKASLLISKSVAIKYTVLLLNHPNADVAAAADSLLLKLGMRSTPKRMAIYTWYYTRKGLSRMFKKVGRNLSLWSHKCKEPMLYSALHEGYTIMP